MEKYKIDDFNKEYSDEDYCLNQIFIHRYGGLSVCPKCNEKTKFYKVSNRKCYACQHCGFQLHPLADTVFAKSSTPLKLWFLAIYLLSNSNGKISVTELQRYLGVTYKTAWRIFYKLKNLYKD